MGRPTEYVEERATSICERLASGESLRSICSDDVMPPESTVRTWVADDRNGFAARYAHARDDGWDSLAHACLTIADGLDEDPASRRVRIDTRLRLLSKWDPKRYGERLDVAHGGNIRVVVEKLYEPRP